MSQQAQRSLSLFVAGTDTGVGKTVVSAILALKTGFHYWKPIQSGLEAETDSQWVSRIVGGERVEKEAYRLSRPLSPHLSAELDGIEIDLDRLVKEAPRRSLIVEGAGGVLTPVRRGALFIDLMASLGHPVILVARTSLGTINHTLLSIEAIRRRSELELRGVIMVGDPNSDNKTAIENFGETRVLGTVPYLPQLTADSLSRIANKSIHFETEISEPWTQCQLA